MKLDHLFVKNDVTLQTIIEQLNKSGIGIVVMRDDEEHLIGTITDGDVRRAILYGCEMSSSAEEVLRYKDPLSPQKPITVEEGTDESYILSLMAEMKIHQIPVLNSENKVVDLVLLDELVRDQNNLAAVLMAGGFGKRLMPMTAQTPKPMLEIGGRPIMERIIDRLKNSGVGQVSVSTHYRHEQISDHFGDGQEFGIDINYIHEDNPLGTAGALSMIEKPSQSVLVMNGDILTELNFKMFSRFHQDHNAVMTVAVRPYEYTVPYGVMETKGVYVKGIKEKPKSRWMINAGIYILAPEAFDYIPENEYFDMPSLMEKLLKLGKNVVCFPIYEYWRDIGQPKDFKAAEDDVATVLKEK